MILPRGDGDVVGALLASSLQAGMAVPAGSRGGSGAPHRVDGASCAEVGKGQIMTGTVIPIAGTHRVYSMQEVVNRKEAASAQKSDNLSRWYHKMESRGGERFMVKSHADAALDALDEQAPNFHLVIEDLRKQLALARSSNAPVTFLPILLLGEPGIGKTHFARSLAKALGTGFEFVPMNSLTAGWVLTGASAQWAYAKPGRVAQTLIEGEYANPVMVLDEVDKAGGDSRYDPLGALYTLLEQETAKEFEDEFIEIPMDASHLLWIATANDEQAIPEPILSRMNVYEVVRPDAKAAHIIARNLYRSLLHEYHWPFEAEPTEAVMETLAECPPRDMRKALIDAFGTASLAGRDYLLVSDFDRRKLGGHGRNRIGFR